MGDGLSGKHDEIQHGVEHSHDPPRISGPIKAILGISLALLIVLMVIPAYNITMDPPPKNIPVLVDVVPADLPISARAPEMKIPTTPKGRGIFTNSWDFQSCEYPSKKTIEVYPTVASDGVFATNEQLCGLCCAHHAR